MKRFSTLTNGPSYLALMLLLPLVCGYGYFWCYFIFASRSFKPLNSFTMSHYLVNYQEFGFIKRGLIGTMLSGFGVPPTVTAFGLLFVGFLFCFIVVSIYFFRWATRDVDRHTPFIKNIAILYILSPLTLMHFACDLGRFDVINVTLLMLSIMVLPRGRGWYAGALAMMGILIHEAFIFAGCPILLIVALSMPPPPPRTISNSRLSLPYYLVSIGD